MTPEINCKQSDSNNIAKIKTMRSALSSLIMTCPS